jgi:hypothetical protein
VVELDPSGVDRLGRLFKQLTSFHREVVEGAWPVRSEKGAWARGTCSGWARGARGCSPRFWAVGVVEVSEDATRLYERAGFRRFYLNLMARL